MCANKLMMQKVFSTVFFVSCLLAIFLSCDNKSEKREIVSNSKAYNSEESFINYMVAMDTLSFEQTKNAVAVQLYELRNEPNKEYNAIYKYFQGRQFLYDNQKDSAIAAFEAMDTVAVSDDMKLLRNYRIIMTKIPQSGVVASEQVNKLLVEMRKAESANSVLTYAIYELLGRCYFQNDNIANAIMYSEKSFENNPYKTHRKVQQRYHDISFLLAARINDLGKMVLHNKEARRLAIETKDSLALARTFDNEARIYALEGKPEKSIESGRQYVKYLLRKNAVTQLAYNNLATSFVRAHQLDSAIYYYQKAIELMNNELVENHVPIHYNGLKEAYHKKHDYKNALLAADSAYTITLRNIKRAEVAKIEEVHEKYQSVKKDKDIHDLKKINILIEKSARQQRWMIISISLVIITALALLATMYRQRLLNNRNALLKEENRRLNTDRKMLQAQLNPHFIFNSIANLQGLISASNTDLASKYLSTFSKLLRDILEQSRKDFIPLEEEVQSIINYLNLQQMRFSGLFDYNIHIDSKIDKENLLIPPMLIQPFIENSIEHGFRNINYKGKLDVLFLEEEDRLLINILDNGRGIENHSGKEKNKTSLSRIILKERLEALFTDTNHPARFMVADRKEQGLKGVEIKISLPKTWD